MKINPDFKSQTLQKNNPVKPYEEIAEGMETSFTSHMLAEMRKTVGKEDPESSSMDYYNSLLDYERAQLMAKSESGLGVKKVILDQIVPQHLKHYGHVEKKAIWCQCYSFVFSFVEAVIP